MSTGWLYKFLYFDEIPNFSHLEKKNSSKWLEFFWELYNIFCVNLLWNSWNSMNFLILFDSPPWFSQFWLHIHTDSFIFKRIRISPIFICSSKKKEWKLFLFFYLTTQKVSICLGSINFMSSTVPIQNRELAELALRPLRENSERRSSLFNDFLKCALRANNPERRSDKYAPTSAPAFLWSPNFPLIRSAGLQCSVSKADRNNWLHFPS